MSCGDGAIQLPDHICLSGIASLEAVISLVTIKLQPLWLESVSLADSKNGHFFMSQ